MPPTLGTAELDALVEELDARITETDLPEGSADTYECSGACTVLICTVVVC
ncbi:hypothetical protein [Streptomyces xiaopingdaonensis]|uniref:hypothetical protein n=1 Tax=Streptomyces xiaopingdaonensis TaxID=1565415 RepID=UPI0003034092|nr:hypothetical protein [Streptomyces xiaopingdaonensis]